MQIGFYILYSSTSVPRSQNVWPFSIGDKVRKEVSFLSNYFKSSRFMVSDFMLYLITIISLVIFLQIYLIYFTIKARELYKNRNFTRTLVLHFGKVTVFATNVSFQQSHIQFETPQNYFLSLQSYKTAFSVPFSVSS